MKRIGGGGAEQKDRKAFNYFSHYPSPSTVGETANAYDDASVVAVGGDDVDDGGSDVDVMWWSKGRRI